MNTVFYLVCAVIVGFAILTVTVRHVLHAALALIASFFGTAALYILLNAEFIAVAQVLVYIGGVVIFIVYGILLTSQLGEVHLKTGRWKKLGALAVSLAVFFTLLFFFMKRTPGQTVNADMGSLDTIGVRFLTYNDGGFIVPFEVISILLFAALVAAITIARSERKDSE